MRSWILINFFLVSAVVMYAQPAEDFNSAVSKLSETEKQRMFVYLRQLGIDSETMLHKGFAALSPEQQLQAEQFAKFLAIPAEERPKTTVQWNRDTLFFGELEEGQLLIDSFEVVNTGKLPYMIWKTAASCDCAVLNYPKYPIMPGEKARVRIEFKSGGKVGNATPGIILYDNSKPNSRTILYLSGKILPRRASRRGW